MSGYYTLFRKTTRRFPPPPLRVEGRGHLLLNFFFEAKVFVFFRRINPGLRPSNYLVAEKSGAPSPLFFHSN